MLEDQPPRPIYRRAGRAVLRGLRPVAAPFLNRIQLRMRQAVEDIGFNGALIQHLGSSSRQLNDLAGQTATRLRIETANAGRLNALTGQIERIEAYLRVGAANAGQMDTLTGQIEQLEEHLRIETASTTNALERLSTRLQAAQIGIDAARLDLTASADGLKRLEIRVAEDLLTMQERITASVEGRVEGLASHVQGQAELLGIMLARVDMIQSLLQDRTNTLLSRVAIPVGDALLMRLPEGFLLIPGEDAPLVASMHESMGRLEPGTVAVIQALLREGDTALDIGANVGLTVLPAARSVGPTGRVIAVEPTARLVELLRRSLVVNGVDGVVTLHRCAAGETAGEAELNIGITSGHSSLLSLPGSRDSETVPVRPMDDLVPSGTVIRLAKIDVEGFEPQTWRGMERILADNPEIAVLVEFGLAHLLRAGTTPEEWLDLFTSAGFAAHEVDEATGAICPVRPVAALAGLPSINLLMLRQPPDSYPGLRRA